MTRKCIVLVLLLFALTPYVGSQTNTTDDFARVPYLKSPSFVGLGRCAVVRVVDGDTLIVIRDDREITVRMIGIDTPETVHPSKPVEPYGREAACFTRNLLQGEDVFLVKDGTGDPIDKYGRTLAYVYRAPDRLFVNAEIIRQGYGYAYTVFAFDYLEEFKALQRFAQQKQKGLWGKDVQAEQITKAQHAEAAKRPAELTPQNEQLEVKMRRSASQAQSLPETPPRPERSTAPVSRRTAPPERPNAYNAQTSAIPSGKKVPVENYYSKDGTVVLPEAPEIAEWTRAASSSSARTDPYRRSSAKPGDEPVPTPANTGKDGTVSTGEATNALPQQDGEAPAIPEVTHQLEPEMEVEVSADQPQALAEKPPEHLFTPRPRRNPPPAWMQARPFLYNNNYYYYYYPMPATPGRTVHVRSYYRKDGTQVRSHFRSPPSR